MGSQRVWVTGTVAVLAVALGGCGSEKPGASSGGAGGAGGAGGTAAGGSSGASGAADSGGSRNRAGSAGTGGRIDDGGNGGSGGSGGKPHVPITLGVNPPKTGSFTDDRDQTEYGWVELNGVKWMSENLKLVLGKQDLQTCYSDGTSAGEDCARAGYFYGWSAAMAQPRIADSVTLGVADGTYQGACPAGWHLPTQADWVALLDYVSELAKVGGPDTIFNITYPGISDPLLSAMGWSGGYGTNELGFDAQPFGEHAIGYETSFWASDETGRQYAVMVDVRAGQIKVDSDLKAYRQAVRCIEGAATEPAPMVMGPELTNTTGTFDDPRDQKSYPTVTIGDQQWLAQNLAFEPSTGDSLCYAEQAEHCRIFGRLYGYDTAQDVCPSGWHIPTVDEWHTLGTYVDNHSDKVGATELDGTFSWKMGKQLVAPWEVWDFGPTEPPSFGFNGLPGGFALDGNQSGGFEDSAVYWSAKGDSDDQVAITLSPTDFTIAPVTTGVEAYVRCLHD